VYDYEVEGGLYVQEDAGGLLFVCVCMHGHAYHLPWQQSHTFIFNNSVNSLAVFKP